MERALRHRARRCEHRPQLLAPEFDAVLRGETRRLAEMAQNGIERGVAVIGRALHAYADMAFIADALDAAPRRDAICRSPASPASSTTWPSPARASRQRSARSAISCVAADQHARFAHRLEAALVLALAQHAPHAERFGDALHRPLAEECVIEELAQEPARDAGDEHAMRFGERLQPGGEIGRVADDGLLLRGAAADDLADDDEAGGDADPRGERAVADAPHRGDDLEPGAGGALGAVLVRLGIAEISEHAVAHELGEETVEARDDAGAGVLVLPDQRPEILGIEPARQRGRADEIGEQHRDLAPLGLALALPLRTGAGGGAAARRCIAAIILRRWPSESPSSARSLSLSSRRMSRSISLRDSSSKCWPRPRASRNCLRSAMRALGRQLGLAQGRSHHLAAPFRRERRRSPPMVKLGSISKSLLPAAFAAVDAPRLRPAR